MFNHKLGTLLCTMMLAACTTMDERPSTSTSYIPYVYDEDINYYSNSSANAHYSSEKSPVTVPESYHVGPSHHPIPHNEVDKSWVKNQKGSAYTIELTESEKPASVANVLIKSPKNERTAEIKSQRDGKTYYKGVYGTYPSYEEAQKAFDNLAPDIKQNAKIKTWGTIQENVE